MTAGLHETPVAVGLSDEPLSIDVRSLISGLADMALMMHGYTVESENIDFPHEVRCHKCNKPIFEFGEMTMLELVHDVMAHHEECHR